MSMRVIFAGTPEFARVALQALQAAGFEVPLVLTQPDRPAGRGMKLQASPVKQLALQHGIAVAQPRSLRLDGKYPEDAAAARAALRAARADAMVVAAYGLILPQWVLDDMSTAGPPQGASAPSGGSATGAAVERGGRDPSTAGPPQGASAPSGGSATGAAAQRGGMLYVTGEESGAQVALRARRLGIAHSQVAVLAEIQLEKILATLSAQQPAVAVIDSIQTVYSDQLTSAPGSVAQVRECAAHLTRWAKASGCAVVLVGHVTKDGQLAGPRVLEHMVDTVLYFEGDTHSSYRLIRAIKNRFGAVNEIGVFAMTERGLKGVSNPSAIFLAQHAEPVPGSCVLVTLEGTRPLLVEVQALVDSGGPSPRRLSVGLERDRLAMLLAVLHRHAGVATGDQDVFVNAVGGVRISEPAADLAVLLAIASSLRGKPLPKGFIAFGEVGLAGEVRPAPRGQERLKEAAKLGFSVALIPRANAPRKADPAFEGMTLHAVERVDEAMALLRTLE